MTVKNNNLANALEGLSNDSGVVIENERLAIYKDDKGYTCFLPNVLTWVARLGGMNWKSHLIVHATAQDSKAKLET